MWLLKDILWLQEKTLAAMMMIIPTVGVSLILTFQSYKNKEGFYLNFAILFWIIANSIWMVDEFYALDVRWMTSISFGMGILIMLFYYIIEANIFNIKNIFNTLNETTKKSEFK